ncbi:MAG: DPP IV N-terminal domain-containing protein [Fimbriimonadales bacterium]|nr:DPP IV N-terminal domain-containing protein [Fimbriimonadales bacterium]
MRPIAAALLATVLLSSAAPARAQANWDLANRFSAESLQPFLYSTSLSPNWIGKTDQFWYSWKDDSGTRYWRVDPAKRTKTPLFDADRMAALLAQELRRPIDALNLQISNLSFDEKNLDLLRFESGGFRFEYDLKSGTIKNAGKVEPPRREAPSFKNEAPDKKAYVYAQDHNLFLVEIVDGKEQPPVQLTTDGAERYSFGSADGTGRGGQRREGQTQQGERRVRPNVTWSKDSKRFFVIRRDSRKVKDLYLVNNLAQPRPTLRTYEYAMPGDPDVPQYELFVFDRESKKLEKLDVARYKDQQLFNVHFQDTASDSLRFVRRDRLQRNLELCETDLKTGKTRVLLSESVENAFLEFRPVRYVKPGGDFLWFSERDGWGHYYLYSNDGKLRNAVTSGPFRASELVDVDADKGWVYVRLVGRDPAENPYHRHLARVRLDGTGLTVMDPGDADHSSVLSPSKRFVVDVFSRSDLPPRAVLRDDDGRQLLELAETDVSKLVELGWRMPERFVVKAADGVTDIHGNLWKPADFDPRKTYPIIAYVYPGPQTEAVTAGFSLQASFLRLANLGFIVVQIGNRGGNPNRSNAYHSFGYGNLRDYGLADKKAGIEQLAARHPWIDLRRVGIYGHSGGGFMTAAAMLLPPYNEFFKVGVSSAGNHDNNIYNANWSEQHHGLREVAVRDRDGKETGETRFEIRVPTTPELAANLKGKLLIVHGDMDDNVHPANSIRLAAALIRAGKRFDFMLMPGQAHGFGDMSPYFNQMLMEYFAEHLLGDRSRRPLADMGLPQRGPAQAAPPPAQEEQQRQQAADD